ncbi:hypothetical protein N7462_008455 [Penicillium macrosclerotiorum]|uniref:uncharacterized protein n=1 Tax=Penicillium macrosclerotiorum TaxID=303699 RepID=UPI0025498A96|nr:uncharacterized protein N7462_008455 [Penicillium macrosclerotiorum]KAJ5675558.1 hypothetical protein N7462_008455 [Penicillium macrosclerotiorum]
MPGLWAGVPRSSRVLFIVLAAVLLINPSPVVFGLKTTSGSPCTEKCHQNGANTTVSDIECLDTNFNVSKGGIFHECIACQLESTYVDRNSGETDVNWGLWNLRYTLTSCIFGYPGSAANISTPCTVGCQNIQSSLETDLTNPNSDNFNNWCSANGFADNVINDCEFCYNLTYGQVAPQVYMANFLESIRYNCHYETNIGDAFAISPSRIFTESLLPSSMSLSTSTTSSSSGVNLALVVTVPVLAFVIVLILLGLCCFCYIRYRRKRVRSNRENNPLYARWHDTTISTPRQNHGWDNPHQGNAASYGAGFGFVDSDGSTQSVGYGYEHGKTPYQDNISEAYTMDSRTALHGTHGFNPDHKM